MCAQQYFYQQANKLKRGSFLLINNEPTKIVQLEKCKTGKHGKGKLHVIALNIITNKKTEQHFPSQSTVQVPYVSKNEYEVIDIDETHLSLLPLNENGFQVRSDVRLPKGALCDALTESFENGKKVTVVVADTMNQAAVLSMR